MQSAFVDIGLERDAFLYITDFMEEQGDSADFESRELAQQPPRRCAMRAASAVKAAAANARRRRPHPLKKSQLPCRASPKVPTLVKRPVMAAAAGVAVAAVAADVVTTASAPRADPREAGSENGERRGERAA